jgi:pSer/pThr/pTyr-binding forkhead associated (FHA) protein
LPFLWCSCSAFNSSLEVERKGVATLDPRLRIFSGSPSLQFIPIPRGKLIIGRAADCDLRLLSDCVSAYHCVLLLDECTLRIRDLGSKNGTFVNGRKIGSSTMILLHDDAISIGEMNVIVELNQATAGPQTVHSTGQPEVSRAELESGTDSEADTVWVKQAAAIPPQPSTPPPVPAPIVPNDLEPSGNEPTEERLRHG